MCPKIRKANVTWIKLLIFISGFVSLGVEISASRLVETHFGSSILVWSTLIGLVLVYLSAGYFLGGKLADRYPYEALFYRIAFLAGFSTGLVPFVADPLLHTVDTLNPLEGTGSSVGLMIALFTGVALLFLVPVTLLGFIPPFALRIILREVEEAGRISGSLYALSTLGSIFGAFTPPLIFIPLLGTRRTFLVMAYLLMGVSLPGMIRTIGRKGGLYLMVLLASTGWLLLPLGSVKANGDIIYETESAYSYIQVIRWGEDIYLRLNEGYGVQSIYNPHQVLSGGIWDYFLVAPLFNDPPFSPAQVKRMCLIGLAGGTVAKLYTRIYGPIAIDGVELDPAIIEAGRRYLAMNEPNLRAIADDGRHFLSNSSETYDVIAVDAYRPPYIPFHLTTREFFQEVRDHLSEQGVVAVNVARTPSDYRLVNAVANTMASIFPSIYIINEPDSDYPIANSLVVATASPTSFGNFAANLAYVENPYLLEVAREVLPRIRVFQGGGPIFTDDYAPVEHITHGIMLEYLLKGR
ncbi:MAG TPA: spermine synthase [Chloroflexi bacterium]|nr:spermine synthase [Chloroflexota bacterium]